MPPRVLLAIGFAVILPLATHEALNFFVPPPDPRKYDKQRAALLEPLAAGTAEAESLPEIQQRVEQLLSMRELHERHAANTHLWAGVLIGMAAILIGSFMAKATGIGIMLGGLLTSFGSTAGKWSHLGVALMLTLVVLVFVELAAVCVWRAQRAKELPPL
jgi:hypothetical protein